MARDEVDSASRFRSLRKYFSQALVEHEMLAPDDHVLVGLSGGKDSWALLSLLSDLRKRSPFPFTISAVTIDGGLVGLDPDELKTGCDRLGIPFRLERQAIFETVAEKKEEGSTFCSMCAKLRRGALYRVASELGATKLALGHHLDDAIETMLLNLFYGGKIAALPPVLLSDSGKVPVIRPLLYCEERELRAYAEVEGFSTIGCACPVCPTHPDHEFSDLKRMKMKQLIAQIGLDIPSLHASARGALRKLEPSRFLDARYSQKAAEIFLSPENSDRYRKVFSDLT